MNANITIIKVRCGINGFRYSACNANGYFIGNFKKLADVRKHWSIEIRRRQVQLIRELDQMTDISKIEATQRNIEILLKAYARRRKK